MSTGRNLSSKESKSTNPKSLRNKTETHGSSSDYKTAKQRESEINGGELQIVLEDEDALQRRLLQNERSQIGDTSSNSQVKQTHSSILKGAQEGEPESQNEC
jgi:hypothetical protein